MKIYFICISWKYIYFRNWVSASTQIFCPTFVHCLHLVTSLFHRAPLCLEWSYNIMSRLTSATLFLKSLNQKRKFFILGLISLVATLTFKSHPHRFSPHRNIILVPLLKNYSTIASFISSREETAEEQAFRQKCYTLFDERKTANFDNETWASYTGVTTHHYEYNLTNGTFPTCENYLSERLVQITQTPVNSWEESFPIAYGILVYHNFAQTEELFRIIYRPQNFYCFHVDVSAEESFKRIVSWLLNWWNGGINSSKNRKDFYLPCFEFLLITPRSEMHSQNLVVFPNYQNSSNWAVSMLLCCVQKKRLIISYRSWITPAQKAIFMEKAGKAFSLDKIPKSLGKIKRANGLRTLFL